MKCSLFFGYSLWGDISGSGRVRALNLTVPLGSGRTISGTGRASILSPCRPLARSEFKLYLFIEVYYVTLHASLVSFVCVCEDAAQCKSVNECTEVK